jgi:hypothetical protein
MSMSYVSGQDGKWSCSKHGEFETVVPVLGEVISDFGDLLAENVPLYNGTPIPQCPTCRGIQEQDLCRECEKHKATVQFSNSAMDYVHGMVERICQCCYVNRIEKIHADVTANLAAQKEILNNNPCDPFEPDSL